MIVYADPIWPKIQTLALTFTGLHSNEAQDFLDFFDDYLGLEVGMIDWEQRYWRGVIVTPENPVVEDTFDSFTASFDFEGELDPTWSPQTVPWLPATPLRRVRSELRTACAFEEPEPTSVTPASAYSAEADDTIAIGQPVYIKSTGHAGMAQANTAATARVIGFAVTVGTPSFTVNYISEGSLTLNDWIAIAGTVSLVPGSGLLFGS